MEWSIQHRVGSAQELHDASLAATIGASGERTVRINQVTGPALVVGSTQPIGSVSVNAAVARGVDVARRHSGGGAVLLGPSDHVWVDVFVPTGDPLADDDVGRASWWLGRAWAAALGGGTVHHGGVTDRDAAQVACFAALGSGEVERAGRKVVGISQRRTRAGARFQCVAYRTWHPEPLLELLNPMGVRSDAWSRTADALTERAAAAVPPGWSVVEDLVPHLR